MPVYPSGGTIAQSVGSPGYGPAPAPPYNVSNSLRFNNSDTASISFTPSLSGSRTTWTMAFWVKRSLLTSLQTVFGNATTTGGLGGFVLNFTATDTIDLYDITTGSSIVSRLTTSQVFRDPGQWYHILIAYDTTQATSSNRLKLFVNGSQVTAFSTATYPTQYYAGFWNTAGVLSRIGYNGVATGGARLPFGGYLADVFFVDGQALTPSSFTSTNSSTGQLIPAQYTGSFGTNGFYLPFSNGALVENLGQNPKTTGQDYPYWPYNSLLIDTTSTNGADNNTFVDSSTNNFTVTRSGNTTQGNPTPFNYGGGTTQSNGYYSGYFDGTGDYLTYPGGAFTGDFTCEFWFFSNSGTATTVGAWIASVNSSMIGYLPTEDRVLFSSSTDASANYFIQLTSANTFPSRTWTHYAVTRSGSTVTLYVNGQNVATGSYSGSVNFNFIARQASYTPRDFNGYISNFRVTNTVVYSSNFTVPTTPLTAISGTQVLTCQSGQFIDNSANAYTVSAFANSQPAPNNPFGMTAWAASFDGTGDYLTAPNNAAFDFGSGNWTIETWVYLRSTARQGFFAFENTAGNNVPWEIGLNATTKFRLLTQTASGQIVVDGTTTPITGVWYHIAAVRNGSTVTLYVNGVAEAAGSISGALVSETQPVQIGRYNYGFELNGALSNVRAVKGTAVYTSNFTPPTAPLTAISGTSLLTCQSSTFVDNSSNAFTITKNGTPYTLTLNNPFNSQVNSTPPVQAWSNYFDGSGDYLSIPDNSSLEGFTGDFTIEFWVNFSSVAGNQVVLDKGWNTTSTLSPYLFYLTGGNLLLYMSAAGATSSWNIISGTQIITGVVPNRWYHVAVCRSGGTIAIYTNGGQVSTTASTSTLNSTTSNLTIGINSTVTAGYYFNGFVSNLRIVGGYAAYTANFTVPTTPLTAISGTSLLTCQSNGFVDNSVNRLVVSASGNTSVSPSSPFFPTTAWSAASYGGSMYFDGSDYLSAPANTAFDFGTGNFTIEAWVYTPATQTQYAAIACNANNPNGWFLSFSTTNLVTFSNWNVSAMTSSSAVPLGAWTHVAVSRSGTSLRMFFNGQQVASATNSTTYGTAGSPVYVGFNSQTHYFSGYISGLRILKGTALYTTPFVPPVAPPTNISNTSLLLNGTNAGIYDAAGNNWIETVGNVQVSTAVKKFGESSLRLNASSSYLALPRSLDFSFGTRDFTVECWVYYTSVPSNYTFIFTTYDGTNEISLRTGDSGFGFAVQGVCGTGAGAVLSSPSYTATSLQNTWTHLALTRIGTTVSLFINGVLQTTITSSASIGLPTTGYPSVGYPGYTPNAYIQDLRITKGVGRYSNTFTPPAAAFAYNQYDIGNQQWGTTNLSVTAGTTKDNLLESPSDYGTDTGLGGEVRGNYPTFNPLTIYTNGMSITDGNLRASNGAAVNSLCTVNMRLPSTGKWYWEVTVVTITAANGFIGVLTELQADTVSSTGGTGDYRSNGNIANLAGTAQTNGATYTSNDIIGVAVDVDAGTVQFYKNGVAQGATPSFSFTPGTVLVPHVGGDNGAATKTFSINFGQSAFSYPAPSTFKCLTTVNLPAPTIGGTSSTQANDYFDVTTYTGTGAVRSVTNSGSMQPDWVWIKGRSQATSSGLFDVLRGPTKVITSNNNAQQATDANSLTSFNSTGFSLGTDATNNFVNVNTQTYVAWQWKANGAGSSNTAGTITSTVSANTTSGFSIATFNAGAAGNKTVGHGLGVVPALWIVKCLSVAGNSWSVGSSVFASPATTYLVLNGTNAATTDTRIWANAAPTSSVISFESDYTLPANSDCVGYFFNNVNGYSKIGLYTGNGSANGPVIYTNFRPAFVMFKALTNNVSHNWVIKDKLRNSNYNPQDGNLYANLANAEDSTSTVYVDFLSNGFKIRGTYAGINAGVSIIYMAFAESPFKYARAR